MDFSNAKSIVIPEGEVSVIARGSEILWQKLRVPTEYQEVSYIESTGTQWVNTGVKLTSNHSVEIDYQFTSIPKVGDRKGLFGGLESNTGRYGSLVSPTTQKMEYGYGKGNTYYQTTIPDTNRHIFKHDKNKLYVDGALVYTFEVASFKQTIDAYLGTFNYTNYTPAKAKYFGSRWWDGDTLIRNYIPCYRKSDGKVGMYDTVTKSFFTNAGTGEFYCEKPKYKTELDYLQSTGTQWINTEIYPSAITYLETEAQYTAINKRQTIMGCYKNSTYNTFGATNATNVYANFFTQWGSDGNYGGSVKSDLKKHRFSYDKTTHTFTVDGSFWIDGGDGFNVNDTLYMFATHSGSTIDRQASVKIYCFKMFNDSKPVRDFIPVLDWKDVPCMYDKVTDTLFYNQGTGEFLYG